MNLPRTPPRRYTYGQILYTYDTPTAEDLWVKTAINRKQGKTAYKQKNPAFARVFFKIDGGQGRDRTGDTRIFSPLLYQLSYLAMGFRVVVSVEMVGAQGFEPWTQ